MTDDGQLTIWGGSTTRGIPTTHPVHRMSRRSDPPTSNGAAVYSMPAHADGRRKALAALAAAGAEGLTDFQLEDVCRIRQTSIGKRRHDLMVLGLVAPLIQDDRQLRRVTRSGATAGVWVITPAGCEAHLAGELPAPPSPDPASPSRSIGDPAGPAPSPTGAGSGG